MWLKSCPACEGTCSCPWGSEEVQSIINEVKMDLDSARETQDQYPCMSYLLRVLATKKMDRIYSIILNQREPFKLNW